MSHQDRPSLSDRDSAGNFRDGFGIDGFGREEYEFAPGPDLDDDYDGLPARSRPTFKWVLIRLGWVGLAATLSLGSAGIVAATGRSPENDSRPELTYTADLALSGRLDAGVRDLAQLNDHVVVLGRMARSVLADLSQVNQVGLSGDYQDGDTAVLEIRSGAAALTARLECRPWPSTRDAELAATYSHDMIDRWHAVCAALTSVDPLASDWAAMENSANVAMSVAHDINDHDQNAKAALQQATQGRYPEALAQLQPASASLANAQDIAAKLSKVGDVSTLTEWLSRTTTMDGALALLWQTMIDSKGRITVQVSAALKAVNDAKALLPDNNSVLQVVLYELAGNLTSDGISIEVAKGQLATALSDLTGGSVVGQ